MKRILTSLCLALLPFAAFAVVPHRQTMPKVDGYVLLLGDCHIHTVFSDDTSWPTTRVDEAAYDGLDFIAITDHCDTRHQKMVNNGTFNGAKVDRNTSYEIAAAAAKKYGILVVHGAELTRGNWMFPGHFNLPAFGVPWAGMPPRKPPTRLRPKGRMQRPRRRPPFSQALQRPAPRADISSGTIRIGNVRPLTRPCGGLFTARCWMPGFWTVSR